MTVRLRTNLTRDFGGERFTRSGWSRFKSQTEIFARSLRDQGWKVRVTKGTSVGGDVGYVIWKRRERRK